MSAFQGDSIFWIEVAKIHPNPYQPRKDFDEQSLSDLAESVRQYGVLQPLVVTRREKEKESGGISVEYELISGERRLRAAKQASLFQVPVIIRAAEENEQMKLELAIIENLQREDLNAIDRAKAFQRLVEEFSFTHSQVAKRVGKSREYVSNSLRLLEMPEQIQQAVVAGQISEGHTRPLMMLNDKPQEQITVFKEVVYKKLTVRETEKIARRIAQDKIRKRKSEFDPRLQELEKNFTETLGTRVQIEPRQRGGKLVIDYFSEDDLERFKELFAQFQNAGGSYEAMRQAFDDAAAAFSAEIGHAAEAQPQSEQTETAAADTAPQSMEEQHAHSVPPANREHSASAADPVPLTNESHNDGEQYGDIQHTEYKYGQPTSQGAEATDQRSLMHTDEHGAYQPAQSEGGEAQYRQYAHNEKETATAASEMADTSEQQSNTAASAEGQTPWHDAHAPDAQQPVHSSEQTDDTAQYGSSVSDREQKDHEAQPAPEYQQREEHEAHQHNSAAREDDDLYSVRHFTI